MTACVTPKHVGEANTPRENQKKGKPGTDSEFNNWRHWSGCGQGVGDFASYSQKPVTPPKANTKNKYNKKQANYPLEEYKQASSYACHIRACKDAQHEMLGCSGARVGRLLVLSYHPGTSPSHSRYEKASAQKLQTTQTSELPKNKMILTVDYEAECTMLDSKRTEP